MTVARYATATFPPGQVCEEKSPFGNNEILRSAQNDRGLSSHSNIQQIPSLRRFSSIAKSFGNRKGLTPSMRLQTVPEQVQHVSQCHAPDRNQKG